MPSSILLSPYEKGAIPGSCMSLFIFSLVYLFAFYSGFNGVLFHVGGFGTFLSTFKLRILFGALSMMGPFIWYLVYYNRASASTRLDIEGARYRWPWHKEHMGVGGVKALEDILPGEQVDYLRRFSHPIEKAENRRRTESVGGESADTHLKTKEDGLGEGAKPARVDAQAAYTDTWRSRYLVIYAILTVYCIIPEIVSLACHNGWMWGIFIVWTCFALIPGTLYYVTKAEALKNVELVGKQMRLRLAANVENHDLSILNFLDDDTIHPPPFSPIPPSILIFAHDRYSEGFANVWAAYFFFCGYLMCLVLGSVEILDDLDESGAAPWAFFGVHLILVTLLWTYAAYDPYSHLRGKVDGQSAKRRWVWHKKHFQSWGIKAVQDVLKPEDISELRETAEIFPINNTPASISIPRVVTVAAPANASTLSMDALLQELQRRANGDNLLEELQQRMNAGDAARAAYVALLGPRRNVDPPSYV
ncbi:hypothetical protein I350_06131 [Cryptococcus amylolentus CBS 6273]|uniref:Uncharacterized protein n=1 Tax=Cryptococcus amylolentus CBS 6273 TaxID=1296118 RepID=A0A1E3JQY1_9TREE|nr:hypothetical protein I350_06131 [Cryptococcus amylolentus CBS 6273]